MIFFAIALFIDKRSDNSTKKRVGEMETNITNAIEKFQHDQELEKPKTAVKWSETTCITKLNYEIYPT